MKRFTILMIVTLLSIRSFAEISLGLNLSSELRNSRNQINPDNSREQVDYNFSLEPVLLINLSEKIELAPFAGLSFGSSTTYNNERKTGDSNNWGFSLGCGVYFRLVGNQFLRFSIGPRVAYSMQFYGDDEYSFSPSVGAPANIDLCFNDRFFVRLSPMIAEIAYNSYRFREEDRHNDTFDFNVITRRESSIGFYITF